MECTKSVPKQEKRKLTKIRALSFFTIDLENNEIVFDSINIDETEIKHVSFNINRDELIDFLSNAVKKLKEKKEKEMN